MGVKNLWDILESCKQTLPLHHLQNKRLCVDLSCWIVQLHTAGRSSSSGPLEKLYLRNLFHRLRALIALNCSLILVTDGSIPALKLATYRRRLGCSNSKSEEETTSQTISPLQRNMGSEFSCMIKEAKLLGMALGIPCLDSLEEGEAQCALLNLSNICDGCFSADSDIFLFGAKTVYRDIFLGNGGHVVCYDMVDIEQKLGYGRNSLIALALLLGCDYSHGLPGFGPETSCQIVKSLGEVHVLQHVMSPGFKYEKKTKKTRQKEKTSCYNRSKQHFQDHEQSTTCEFYCESNHDKVNKELLQVADAYFKPNCHSVDSDVVIRVCAPLPFKRDEVQQICAQCFGWGLEKTDQYILPKIAERNLRRFANLRATSSRAGVQVQLKEMPVPCPVSAIIKPRKVQGQEHYEVSWQGIDGLASSVVPADLIQSACPEIIAEFMEVKCKKNGKTKPRSKKSNKDVMHELDLQLQGLMLSIESESSKHIPTSICRLPSTTANTVPDTEAVFIDLLSPPLPIRARNVTKHQENLQHTNAIATHVNKHREESLEEHQNNVSVSNTERGQNSTADHVDVIDIVDSDDDVSPEHLRKVRELKMFIKRINDDL